MQEITYHPLANCFPLIEGQEFRDLVEDIRANGLREPVVLYDGKVLDGRNRLRACHAAQAAARFITFEGKDPLAFVISVNLRRRHLDPSQRALIAADLSEFQGRRGPPLKSGARYPDGKLARYKPLGKTKKKTIQKFVQQPALTKLNVLEASRLMNVSEMTIRHAKLVLDRGVPALVEAVKAGKATVGSAAEIARLPRAQQKQIIASEKLARAGMALRRRRLIERRERRAAEAASGQAVFDHIKIDGRSVGNIRLGECNALATTLIAHARLLKRIAGHCANADQLKTVRESMKAQTLSVLIARALKKLPSSKDGTA